MRTILSLFLCVTAVGCAPQPTAKPITQDYEDVVTRLQGLGTMRFPLDRPGAVVPAELNASFSWSWSGDLDEAVRALAERVGYQTEILGADQAVQISINAHGTAYSLFRGLAAAAGDRADVVLNPRKHLVQVIHHA